MVHITGIGSQLPGEPIDNAMLGARFAIDPQWIAMFIGNTSRHLTTDLETGEVLESLADLAVVAARRALADAGLEPADVGFVILATATPDELMPATVNIVAERLGLAGLPTFQVQSGCTGALQAVVLGRALIMAGEHARGLVIGGDNTAKFIVDDVQLGALSKAEIVNYALFSDGAGAVVLDREPRGRSWSIEHIRYAVTSHDHPPGQLVRWRGARADAAPLLMEDYKAIETLVPKLTQGLLAELRAVAEEGGSTPSWFLLPQLSGRMSERLVETLAIPPERCVNCVAVTGNNGNALPFLQLEALARTFAPGETAALMAIESSKWLRAGMLLRRAAA